MVRGGGWAWAIASPARAVALYAAAAVVAVGALYLYARFGFTDLAQLAQTDMADHGDFLSFVGSAAAWRAGGDPYLPDPVANVVNLNPPSWMPVFATLGLFDPVVAYRMWTVVSVALLVVAAMWVAREIDAPPAVAVLGAASLLVSGQAISVLWQGQVYVPLLLGLIGAWVLERRGQTWWSAVVLGVVAALKPSMLPLLAWPLVQRRWRDAVAGAGGFVATMLFGVLIAGPSATVGWVRALARDNGGGYFENVSLSNQARRLFTPNFSTGHLADLPAAVPAATLLGLVILAVTIWLARNRELGMWAIVAASLLAAPVSWRGYLILLFPAVVVLLARRESRAAGVLLVAIALVPLTLPGLWPDKTTAEAVIGLLLPVGYMVVHWAVVLFADGRTSATAPRAAAATEEHRPSVAAVP
ncbi:glycosyltransferase family 87 protein [Actinomycetospora sp. C-140]